MGYDRGDLWLTQNASNYMALVFTSLLLKNIAYVRPRIWLVGCWRGRASPRWASLGQAGPQWAPDEPLTSFSLMCKRPDLWICYYFPCQIFSITVPDMSKITNQWRIYKTLTSVMQCWCNCSIGIANSATDKIISYIYVKWRHVDQLENYTSAQHWAGF